MHEINEQWTRVQKVKYSQFSPNWSGNQGIQEDDRWSGYTNIIKSKQYSQFLNMKHLTVGRAKTTHTCNTLY